MSIVFNQPYVPDHSGNYFHEVMASGKLSGDGMYSQRCVSLLQQRYGWKHVLLTGSCTQALELSGLILDIQPGDEVIIPSYTYVSTANAYALRGAQLIFADSCSHSPNLDPHHVASLITPRTRGMVCMHYAGISCDMPALMTLCQQHGLWLVEDAAQCIDAYGYDQPLGSFGCMSAFSFHDTKNITCGEGGMLVINDDKLWEKAITMYHKGTNRQAFITGTVPHYEWVSLGSSFTLSEIQAALLLAGLESVDDVQLKRKTLWECYHTLLEPLASNGLIRIASRHALTPSNGHSFYVICNNEQERRSLQDYLSQHHIGSASHYQALHQSGYAHAHFPEISLPHSERYTRCLLRLPLHYHMSLTMVKQVCDAVNSFFSIQSNI